MNLRPCALIMGSLGLILFTACNGSGPDEDINLPPLDPPLACAPAEAPVELLELAEASGATWIESAWGTGWLVIADAGHKGKTVLISSDGLELKDKKLPLDDDAGDDFEGLAAAPGGSLVALTSDGQLREWQIKPSGPVLSRLSYPVSPDPFWLCDEEDTDEGCGPDYEGICLDPSPTEGACAGFVLSKARGLLVCLEDSGSGYALDPTRMVNVGEPGEPSACDYELDPPHRLLVGLNNHGDNALLEVRSPRDLSRHEVVHLAVVGPDHQEAIAFGPEGLVLLVGDNQDPETKEAPVAAARCQ